MHIITVVIGFKTNWWGPTVFLVQGAIPSEVLPRTQQKQITTKTCLISPIKIRLNLLCSTSTCTVLFRTKSFRNVMEQVYVPLSFSPARFLDKEMSPPFVKLAYVRPRFWSTVSIHLDPSETEKSLCGLEDVLGVKCHSTFLIFCVMFFNLSGAIKNGTLRGELMDVY